MKFGRERMLSVRLFKSSYKVISHNVLILNLGLKPEQKIFYSNNPHFQKTI